MTTSRTIIREAERVGPVPTARRLGAAWPSFDRNTSDQLLQELVRQADPRHVAEVLMDDAEREAHAAMITSPTKSVFRCTAKRRASGWALSRDDAFALWRHRTPPVAYAVATVNAQDIFASKIVNTVTEIVMRPGYRPSVLLEFISGNDRVTTPPATPTTTHCL